jgi:hypothetical protein
MRDSQARALGGTRRWLFRYQWKRKRTRIAIGDFPEIGVAQARERAITHQNQINCGIDPRVTDQVSIKQRATTAPRAHE